MTAPLCCVCGVEPRFENGVLCKGCKAEVMLTEGPRGISAIEALAEKPHNVNATVGTPPGDMAKASRCESCLKVDVYDPLKRKTSYFCDECGRQLCPSCAAYCSHKDWNYTNKILCKNCRAEKSLTGQPVEEVEGSLPGQETAEPKREPKPHCGRATCVGDTADPEWCRCECLKCKTAVGAGFFVPMFGKMTPDPEPEPESKKTTRRMSSPRPRGMSADERAEWEAHRREAEQA